MTLPYEVGGRYPTACADRLVFISNRTMDGNRMAIEIVTDSKLPTRFAHQD